MKTLRVMLPMQASELERVIRTHCEHHGVWDDCTIELDPVRAEPESEFTLSGDAP